MFVICCSNNPSLPDSLWNKSTWISVKKAPIVKGDINDHTRSANGANWIVSSLTNEKEVVSHFGAMQAQIEKAHSV